jgi:hypothetical protein
MRYNKEGRIHFVEALPIVSRQKPDLLLIA